MKRFIATYRTEKNGLSADYIFASNKAHAFGIARERFGSRLVRVENDE